MRRRLTGTVRFRVTALAALVALAVLVLASAGLVLVQARLLIANLDDAIGRRADEISALIAAGQSPSSLVGGGDDSIAQVVTLRGEVVAATPTLAGAPPIADPPPAGEEVERTVAHLPPDDQSFRVLSRVLEVAGGPPLVLHVAGALDDISENVAILRTSLTIAVPLVVLLLAALEWWLVGRTLHPVEAIRAEAASMTGEDLGRRLPELAGDDEIAHLAGTMNAMLDRVQAASDRQRSFVADASHELRSPLARIRSEMEVDLAHPDGAELAATHRSVLDEVGGMQRLVDDLLHLARSDSGAVARAHRRVDLDDLVLAQAQRLRAEGRVTVETSGIGAAQVSGDPDQLSRALANLADNAARHAAEMVTFTLEEGEHQAVLTVADDGPGIPAGKYEQVFERFTRLDDARTAGTGGTGLGLAITRDIVSHHGGTVGVDPGYSDGARFVVTLPLS